MNRRMLLLFSLLANLVFLAAGFWVLQKLGGWNYLKYRMKHDGVSGVYEHRKNILNAMPADSNTIVFLGNSLTAQYEWAEAFDNPKIKNRGIPGDGVEGVLARLPHILQTKPSKIFLMIGINDLIFTTPESILRVYRNIVEKIHQDSPPTELYLQSLLPVNPTVRQMPIDNQNIEKVNEGIRTIAKEFGDTYIDLHPLFTDEQGRLKANLTQDGIHLDAPGYEIWKNALSPYLND